MPIAVWDEDSCEHLRLSAGWDSSILAHYFIEDQLWESGEAMIALFSAIYSPAEASRLFDDVSDWNVVVWNLKNQNLILLGVPAFDFEVLILSKYTKIFISQSLLETGYIFQTDFKMKYRKRIIWGRWCLSWLLGKKKNEATTGTPEDQLRKSKLETAHMTLISSTST